MAAKRKTTGRKVTDDRTQGVRDLGRLLEEIRPFVKPRAFKVHSTAGEWRESSELALKTSPY